MLLRITQIPFSGMEIVALLDWFHGNIIPGVPVINKSTLVVIISSVFVSAIAARCCVGKVHETLAKPDHQTPLTQDTWQDVRGLRSLSYAPCPWLCNEGVQEPEMRRSVASQWPCLDPLDLWNQRQSQNNLCFTTTETWHRGHHIRPSLSATRTVWTCTTGHVLYQVYPLDIAWCCQPHLIGHGQQLNLKSTVWMDG